MESLRFWGAAYLIYGSIGLGVVMFLFAGSVVVRALRVRALRTRLRKLRGVRR